MIPKHKILKIYSLFIIVLILTGFLTPFFVRADEAGWGDAKVVNTLTTSTTLDDSDAMKNSIDIETGEIIKYDLLEQSLPGVKSDNLGVYLGGIFKLAIGIATVLAVLMIIIGGFQYITSEAISSKGDAKKRINDALLGLVLVLASWLILNTINTDLVNFNTNLDPVKVKTNPPKDKVITGKDKLDKFIDSPITKNDEDVLKYIKDNNILGKNWVGSQTINIPELEAMVRNGEITQLELKSLLKTTEITERNRDEILYLYNDIDRGEYNNTKQNWVYKEGGPVLRDRPQNEFTDQYVPIYKPNSFKSKF